MADQLYAGRTAAQWADYAGLLPEDTSYKPAPSGRGTELPVGGIGRNVFNPNPTKLECRRWGIDWTGGFDREQGWSAAYQRSISQREVESQTDFGILARVISHPFGDTDWAVGRANIRRSIVRDHLARCGYEKVPEPEEISWFSMKNGDEYKVELWVRSAQGPIPHKESERRLRLIRSQLEASASQLDLTLDELVEQILSLAGS